MELERKLEQLNQDRGKLLTEQGRLEQDAEVSGIVLFSRLTVTESKYVSELSRSS